MVESADDRRFESGSIRGFADVDADLALTHLRVTFRGELVGTLAATEDGVLAFQYADPWIEGGFSISPFSLPLERKVFVADPHPLDDVFDDSLPDGWGAPGRPDAARAWRRSLFRRVAAGGFASWEKAVWGRSSTSRKSAAYPPPPRGLRQGLLPGR